MKRILSLILTAFLVLAVLPLGMFTAYADVNVSEDATGGYGDNSSEVEDTLEDINAEVTVQDDITAVDGLAEIIADETKNIILGWGNTATKGEPLALCTTYTSGTTVDKVFQTSAANVANMTNGTFNESHSDFSGGHRWFDSNKEYVEGYIDMTFNFPVAASVTNLLFANTKESTDRMIWEYQVFAGDELATLYTDANLLYHYNKDCAATPTDGQYITFGKTIEAKYFGIRILNGCNPNSADSNRGYAYPRIREVALIGSCVIPDEYKATASKWIQPCIDALDTDYNLLNGADYVAGTGEPGTITTAGFDGTKAVTVGIRSYNSAQNDLVDHTLTGVHADIHGVKFMDGSGNYIEGAYSTISVALQHEAIIDKVFLSHAVNNNSGLRTYEYEIYAGDSLDTLYNVENKKWYFLNENAVQNQVYEFPEPITAKYVGIKVLKGVMPNCTAQGSSYVRMAEIAVFGKYNTDYFDYSVTSGEAGLITAKGNTYKNRSLTFSAPLCKDGYTFRGWKVNGETAEDYVEDIYENYTELTLKITEKTDIEAVYTADDSEFTSNDRFTLSADKTQIRVPINSVLYDLRYGFEQFPANISAKRGDTPLQDKNFIKKGDTLILSSKGEEKQKLSVVIAGDCNYDGNLTVSDAVSGIDTILRGTATSDQFFSLDLNNSSSITVSDIVNIRNTILTTPTEETDYENVTIPMADLSYKTQGRYLKNTDGSLTFDWTASGFSFNADLYGDIVLNINQVHNDAREYTAVIDGVEHTIRITGSGTKDIIIARGLSSGVHSIGFYKQCEGGQKITVNSVKINGKVLEADAEADLLIEFIGDSITCGAGNMLENGKETGVAYTQDGYNAYGTVTARLLGADWSNISVSGSSLIDDRNREASRNHMPTEYKNAVKGSNPKATDTPAWDFAANRNADIVVINLGTNDNGFIHLYSGVNTSSKTEYFKNLAIDFAHQIIEANGEDVKIVFAFGLMTSDPNFADAAYQQAVTELAAEGYTNAFYCRLPTDNTGGYAHPTVAGDWAAARVLSEFIKTEVLK